MIVSMAARSGSGRDPGGGGAGSVGRTILTIAAPVTSKMAKRPILKASTRRADPTVGISDLCPPPQSPKPAGQSLSLA